MGNWRLCGSFGFRAAGILQVMGKPEVIQKPGVLQSVGGGGGGLDLWAARSQDSRSKGFRDNRDPRENWGSGGNELMGDLEVMRAQRGHPQV